MKLFGWGLLLLATILFGFLSHTMRAGHLQQFDEAILLDLRNPSDLADVRGPQWVEEFFRDATALGGATVLTGLTVATALFLLLERNRKAAFWIAITVILGHGINLGLKAYFDRPRPDVVPHRAYFSQASFPSGHAMMSSNTYLTIGLWMGERHPAGPLRRYPIWVAMAVALAVGVSRVILGVHWPSDVVAGWLIGIVWALFCWLIYRWVRGDSSVPCNAGDEPA